MKVSLCFYNGKFRQLHRRFDYMFDDHYYMWEGSNTQYPVHQSDDSHDQAIQRAIDAAKAAGAITGPDAFELFRNTYDV